MSLANNSSAFSGKSLSLCHRDWAPQKTLCPKYTLTSQIVSDLQLLLKHLKHKTGILANISNPRIQQEWGSVASGVPENCIRESDDYCWPVFRVTGVWDDAEESCHLFPSCPQEQVSFSPLKSKIQHLLVFFVFHPEGCGA